MKNSGKALDEKSLQELAIRYVSRYATTKHKLRSFLSRKIREKGWSGDDPPEIAAMAERFEKLGYINDALFAETKARDLAGRGYGGRRVSQALFPAGIDEADQKTAIALSDAQKWDAASIYARKKNIGPFASEQYDKDRCRKLLQAFLRAGHSYDIASRFVFAKPGEDISEY